MIYKTLKGKCVDCLGCNLLEDDKFSGVIECDNHISCFNKQDKVKTHKKEVNQTNQKIIDKYWTGD